MRKAYPTTGLGFGELAVLRDRGRALARKRSMISSMLVDEEDLADEHGQAFVDGLRRQLADVDAEIGLVELQRRIVYRKRAEEAAAS